MSDILCDCADELLMNKFPCKAIDYGFPQMIILRDPNGVLAVAGETPTLAEIQAGIAAALPDKLILLEEITNGQRTESSREEETGADTADGLTNTFGLNMVVTGRVKLIDEGVRDDLARLNCLSRLTMWFVTNKGFIFGGKTGFKIANFIPQMIMEGFGVRGYYPINFVYVANLLAEDPAGQDNGFLDLVNSDAATS